MSSFPPPFSSRPLPVRMSCSSFCLAIRPFPRPISKSPSIFRVNSPLSIPPQFLSKPTPQDRSGSGRSLVRVKKYYWDPFFSPKLSFSPPPCSWNSTIPQGRLPPSSPPTKTLFFLNFSNFLFVRRPLAVISHLIVSRDSSLYRFCMVLCIPPAHFFSFWKGLSPLEFFSPVRGVCFFSCLVGVPFLNL